MKDDKAYASTPAETLEQHIMDSGIAKSEAEWWACDTIHDLRAENARLREALKPFADLYNPDENVYLDMRLDAGFNPGIVVPMKDLRAARAALGEKECWK